MCNSCVVVFTPELVTSHVLMQDGSFAIHHAVLSGDTDKLLLLLEHKANVNVERGVSAFTFGHVYCPSTRVTCRFFGYVS